MPLPDHNCKWCRFWDHEAAYRAQAGETRESCRRHAPTATTQGVTKYPITRGDDWCGDFERAMQG